MSPEKQETPMARRRRPDPIHVDPLRAYVVRGPRKEDGRWYWRITIRDGGKPRAVTDRHGRSVSGWYNRQEATELVAALVAGREHETPTMAPGDVTTVEMLMLLWLSHQRARAYPDSGQPRLRPTSYESYFRIGSQIIGAIGALELTRITLPDLEAFADEGLARGWSSRTVRQQVRILRMAWKWGRARGYTPDRGLPTVETPEPQRVYNHRTPTDDEVARVVDALAGLQVGERLRWYARRRRVDGEQLALPLRAA